MTYAYVIVIYVTYMGCQKTCGGRFLYIKIFLATFYIIKCLLAFTIQLSLDNKETPSILLLSFSPCIVFLHIVMLDILIRCSLIAEYEGHPIKNETFSIAQ